MNAPIELSNLETPSTQAEADAEAANESCHTSHSHVEQAEETPGVGRVESNPQKRTLVSTSSYDINEERTVASDPIDNSLRTSTDVPRSMHADTQMDVQVESIIEGRSLSDSAVTSSLLHNNLEENGIPTEPIPANSSKKKDILLQSNVRFRRNYSTWALAVVSITFSMFTLVYAWNSSSDSPTLPHLLWSNPQRTIFTINLLYYVTSRVLNKLFLAGCDYLRWSLSCGGGVSLSKFLALSPTISLLGLVQLLCSRSVGRHSSQSENGSDTEDIIDYFRLLPAFRLLVVALNSAIAIFLMFNIDFVPTFSGAIGESFPAPGGVLPINISALEGLSSADVELVRTMATLTLGNTYSRKEDKSSGFLKGPTLRRVFDSKCGWFGDDNPCESIFLIRYLEGSQLKSAMSTGHEFLKLYQAPFYHIHVGVKRPGRNLSSCRTFEGLPGSSMWNICADNLETEKGKFLSVGSYPCRYTLTVEYNWGNLCSHAHNDSPPVCVPQGSIGFDVSILTREADLIYSLRNQSIAQVYNIKDSPEIWQELMDADDYLKILDLLYEDRPEIGDAGNQLFRLTHTTLRGYPGKGVDMLVELVLMPLTQQQGITMPQIEFNATLHEQSYKTSFSFGTEQLFTAWISIMWIFCLSLLISSRFIPIDALSFFPEFDIAIMHEPYKGDSHILAELGSESMKRWSWDMRRYVVGVQVKTIPM